MPAGKEKAFALRLHEHVRRINPQAVLIASGSFANNHVSAGMYDVAMNSGLTATIQRFFHPADGLPGATFLVDLAGAAGQEGGGLGMIMLSAMDSPRLLTRFSHPLPRPGEREAATPGPAPSESAVDHWRLATVFQHLSGGPPVTFYGDEVGMHGGSGAFARAPMWWDDRPEGAAGSAQLREDFRLLVQWLHGLREKYPPLRTGAFRAVLQDDSRRLLAFSRKLGAEEVIVLMNYGDDKQEVQLAAGTVGQLLAVMSPHLKLPPAGEQSRKPMAAPSRTTPRLQVGGSRQYVDGEGKITLSVGPKSVRIVFVSGQ
jgi:glycosidase